MSKKFIIAHIVVLTLFMSFEANAFTLKKGTVSFSGSSSFSFGNADTDKTSSYNYFNLGVSSGYFVADNFEIGLGLSGSYSNGKDEIYKGISIAPFITYHFNLNKESNIFTTLMYGISKRYEDMSLSSTETDGRLFSAAVGWEYFFNPSISTTIGIRYVRENIDLEEQNYNYSFSYTTTRYATDIGFKIYF